MNLRYDGEHCTGYTTQHRWTVTRIKDGHGQVGTLTKNELTGEETVTYNALNHLDSNELVVDEAGNVIRYASYLPYGEPQEVIEADVEPKSELGYSGQEQDATGLHYYGYRYLQGSSGIWNRTDPIRFESGQLNLYGMLDGNPVRGRDERGLSFKDNLGYEFVKNMLLPELSKKLQEANEAKEEYESVEQWLEQENLLSSAFKTAFTEMRERNNKKNTVLGFEKWDKYIEKTLLETSKLDTLANVQKNSSFKTDNKEAMDYFKRFKIVAKEEYKNKIKEIAKSLGKLKDYTLIVSRPGKSNFWVTARVLKQVKLMEGNAPEKIIPVGVQEKGIKESNVGLKLDLGSGKDIVFLDDGSFSGSQLSKLIKKVMQGTHGKNVKIGLIALSDRAFNKIGQKQEKYLAKPIKIEEANKAKMDKVYQQLHLTRHFDEQTGSWRDGNHLLGFYYKIPDYASVRDGLLKNFKGVNGQPMVSGYSEGKLDIQALIKYKVQKKIGATEPYKVGFGNNISDYGLELPNKTPEKEYPEVNYYKSASRFKHNQEIGNKQQSKGLYLSNTKLAKSNQVNIPSVSPFLRGNNNSYIGYPKKISYQKLNRKNPLPSSPSFKGGSLGNHPMRFNSSPKKSLSYQPFTYPSSKGGSLGNHSFIQKHPKLKGSTTFSSRFSSENNKLQPAPSLSKLKAPNSPKLKKKIKFATHNLSTLNE